MNANQTEKGANYRASDGLNSKREMENLREEVDAAYLCGLVAVVTQSDIAESLGPSTQLTLLLA